MSDPINTQQVRSKKTNKVSISLRFDPDLLRKIDEIAKRRGMSRNSIISYWCSKSMESE